MTRHSFDYHHSEHVAVFIASKSLTVVRFMCRAIFMSRRIIAQSIWTLLWDHRWLPIHQEQSTSPCPPSLRKIGTVTPPKASPMCLDPKTSNLEYRHSWDKTLPWCTPVLFGPIPNKPRTTDGWGGEGTHNARRTEGTFEQTFPTNNYGGKKITLFLGVWANTTWWCEWTCSLLFDVYLVVCIHFPINFEPSFLSLFGRAAWVLLLCKINSTVFKLWKYFRWSSRRIGVSSCAWRVTCRIRVGLRFLRTVGGLLVANMWWKALRRCVTHDGASVEWNAVSSCVFRSSVLPVLRRHVLKCSLVFGQTDRVSMFLNFAVMISCMRSSNDILLSLDLQYLVQSLHGIWHFESKWGSS